jgi:glycosyltransferase involved in cell wall biosynthesis
MFETVTDRRARLRILFLTAEYPPYVWGGLGRYSGEAVTALRKIARVDVLNIPSYYRTLVCRTGGSVDAENGIHLFHEKGGGVVVHALLDESLDLFRAEPSDLRTAVDEAFGRLSSAVCPLLAPTYDVVYAQDYYTAPFAVRLHLHGIGRKLVVMCHLPVYAGFTYFDKPHSDEVHQALEAAGVRLADAVVVPSAFTKRILTMTHAIHPDRIYVIGEGVVRGLPRTVDMASTPTMKLRILSIGRIVEQKGWHYTADSLSALRRLGVHFTFSLIGRGPQEPRLLELFHSAGLESVLERIPSVDHGTALSMYARADIFLSTALYETFGLTVLEAMSRGCIPVAFELPPLVELIGDAGIIVPVGDTEAIARSIASLAADGNRRASLVERCQHRADLFTWDAHAEALVDLMETLA